MTAEELMSVINLANGRKEPTDMSSFEHFEMAERTARRPSGTAIAGVVTGSVGVLVAIGAWVYAGVTINQVAKSNNRAIDLLAQQAMNERTERIGYQNYHSPNVIDYINVKTGGATANSLAQAEALAMVYNNNNGNVCPKPVALYQPAMPCACPQPCGCNQENR